MQITSLNKTINLLIIGSFALINALLLDKWFLNSFYFQSFIIDNQITQNQAWWGVISVPLIIFLGMLVDTIGEILKVIVRKLTPSKGLSGNFYSILGVYKDFSIYSFWKSRLEGRFPTELYEHATKNGIGTTIFFENAKEPSVNWVISHYVSYLMARGFLVVMVVDLGFFLFNGYLLKSLIIIFIIYLLVSQFLGKIYYAYSFLFRFSDLHVSGFFKQYESIENNTENLPTTSQSKKT